MKCTCHSHDGFLTERGYAELAQQRSLEGLTPASDSVIVDMVGSVSGLELERDLYADVPDQLLDEQVRRSTHGS